MNHRRRCFLKVVAAVWLFIVPAFGQSQPAADGAQQFAALGDFKLQSGEVIHDFRLGYRTLGKLNSGKSNAILWATWLGSKTEELLEYCGPGKVLDTGRYFVILVDSIGNGVTSSPSNSGSQPGLKFPRFAIRDMAEADRRLATEVLGIPHLRAVMGVSMGGMQVFELAVAYPDFMDVAISLSGSPQSTSADKILWSLEIEAMELDPAWNNGNPKGPLSRGVALAEQIDTMNVTSPAYRAAHTKPVDAEKFLAAINKKARTEPGVVIDQIRQRQAIIALDVPGEFGVSMEQAAKRVHARTLVMVSPQDHMVNPGPAEEFAKYIGAAVITLDSNCGHLSFTCISVGPIVAKFLERPASVGNQTLREGSQ